MFGINGGELIILLLVVALVVGPERLPGYAEQLAGWVRQARDAARDARRRVDDELGGTDVDWEALDPRRYDPRRIVRDALLDDPGPRSARPPGPSGPVAAASVATLAPGVPAPFDDEAT